jgi:alpha-glucosidase (family GH31 glycosyl hydrolase)
MVVRTLLLASLALLVACGDDDAPLADAGPPDADPACRFATAADTPVAPPLHTPRWAFEPWISKDISDGPDTYAFVDGFVSRDIPVGVVVLDSPWETHYNTFVPSPTRYPDFPGLVDDLRRQDIRLVLWVTQMVNTAGIDLEPGGDAYEGPSPNFAEGERCGFFVDDAKSYLWWKGAGAGLDFFHPDARGWWHRQQDALLDLGVAGWKLDFGEQYLQADPVRTAAGPVALQAYSEAYYADFYAYGASRVGTDDFVTMVRGYDQSYGFPGRTYARPEHAPVVWAGDNRRDWVGLVDALDHTFRSAQLGYQVVGSDIGGYLDRDDVDYDLLLPFDTLVFARWTALSALSPFMQLHGRANITPWTVPDHVDETVAMYRYWSTLHHELVPFLYSLAEAAYAGGPDMLRPLGDGPDAWPGDWRYLLGDAFLVAPLLDASGAREVELPAGRWYDWWAPAAPALPGGTSVAVAIPADDRLRLPVYVREGAIVPVADASALTGLGGAWTDGADVVAIWPAASATSFTVHDADGATTVVSAERAEAGAVTVTLSRAAAPVVLRVRADAASAVSVDGQALAKVAAPADLTAGAWAADPSAPWVWVKLPAAGAARTVTIAP